MSESHSPNPNPPSPGKGETASGKRKRAELRRHVRFVPERANAELYLKGFLTTIGIGRKNEARATVNLSESGALVILNSKFPPGTKVQIRIEMEQYKDVIQSEGEIMWCYQSAKNSSDFYAGVQFKNLPPAQAAHIAKMRAWFLSPEYKLKTQTRRRLAPPDLIQ